MKDATCVVRDIDVTTGTALVAGFVRVLDSYEGPVTGALHVLVLCDEDEIVWRLCFEVVRIDAPRKGPCLTGLTYIGRWPDAAAVVFMHPPQRSEDVPWEPGRADMTLVTP